jgi:hypothetical protein
MTNFVTQFSISGENKEGALATILSHLAYGGVNIRGIIIADRGDTGVIRLIVNDPIKTERIFKETAIEFRKVDVLAVRMPDRPGALHQVTAILATNKINIKYIYPLIGSSKGAAVIFNTEDLQRTSAILLKEGIELVDQAEL